MSSRAWSWGWHWAALRLRLSLLWASSSRHTSFSPSSFLLTCVSAKRSKPVKRFGTSRWYEKRGAGTTGGFEMADCRGASPVLGGILFFHRAQNLVVVRHTSTGRWALQCSRHRLERPASLRCADSGKLPPRFRVEQLAEQRAATPVADFSVWRDVCDALAYFRRGNGYRAGPADRQANNGDCNWKSTRQILNCCFFVH